MAVQMAAGSLTSVEEMQAVPMPADCPMMAAMASTPDAAEQSDVDGAKSCPTCQLCMGLAVETLPASVGTFIPPASPPDIEASFFASADLAQPRKPPIF